MKKAKKTAAPAATKTVAPVVVKTITPEPKAESQISLFDVAATKEAPKAEEKKVEEKKVEAPAAKEEPKKEVAPKAAAKKEAAPKKAAAPKTAAKKETAVKKETAPKAAEKKTSAAKSAAPVVSTVLELPHNAYTEADLAKIATDVWVYDLGKKAADIKSIELYVKPAENRVYYVINKETAGSFQI